MLNITYGLMSSLKSWKKGWTDKIWMLKNYDYQVIVKFGMVLQ